jgi:hypothetical protein
MLFQISADDDEKIKKVMKTQERSKKRYSKEKAGELLLSTN